MSTGKSPATPAATDLAFSAARPYGSVAEPTYSGALSFLRISPWACGSRPTGLRPAHP